MVQALRIIYGFVLAAMLFIPFGVYHSLSEPYVIENLWGYNLPIGYVGLMLGLLVVLYQKIEFMKGFKFGSIMLFVGIFLIVSFLFSPREVFINLLHGTSFSSGQIDIDAPVGNSVAWGLSLFSITAGLLLRIMRSNSKN
jgi:hypothetical protein